MRSIRGGTLGWNIEIYSTPTNQFDWSVSRAYVINIYIYIYTVLPALRANSCIDFDRLMIELLDFHIPFLSFTNAGFKGYGKNLLNRRLRITLLP